MPRLFLMLLALGLSQGLFYSQGAWGDDDANKRAKLVQGVKRFGYQLQHVDPVTVAASVADLVIIEPEKEKVRFTKEQVTALKKKQDGHRRLVIAYLSIGEAENYRAYWQKEWAEKKPTWLDDENPKWKGNYKVKYWEKGWQDIILAEKDGPLQKIIADGYDGVYLDIIDGFEYWEEKGVKDARTKMVAWVKAIASQGRQGRPEFLIIPQNGEALATEKGYLQLIDALGKEDVFFEGDKIHKKVEVEATQKVLKLFQDAGKPIFLTEYCQKNDNVRDAITRAKKAGYLPLITPRRLDKWHVSAP